MKQAVHPIVELEGKEYTYSSLLTSEFVYIWMFSDPTNGHKQMRHYITLYYQGHILQQQHCLDDHSMFGFPSPLLNPTLSQSDLNSN